MNKIEELLTKHCPKGVPMAALGDICEILDSRRKPVSKSNRESGAYPYYGANGIQDYVSSYIFDGTYLLVGEDGSVINSDSTPVLTWATGKIWVNNHAHILDTKKDVAILRYVYYALQGVNIKELVHGIPPKLNQSNLRSIHIPLPPLPVQQEIVRILDSFTDLQQNLQQELEARKKQFEVFREKLLSFNETVCGSARLDSICEVMCVH